ncbi:MAG: methyl-accepting chemotaxis protein [Pseudomonadota bacterium]|nr:methyl-accepting chemotaxis protein [Pseudomonadota bacterium]
MRVSTLNHMKLWQKLAVLVLAMSLPATVVGFFYLRSTSGGLEQSRAELAGSAYLRAIGSFQAAVLTHEGRAFVQANGDSARAAATQAASAAADAALTKLQKLNARLGLRYGVRKDLSAIAAQWRSLESNSTHFNAEQTAAAHQKLLVRLGQLRDAVAAGSLAESDPAQSSRSLLQIASQYAPAALTAETALRRYAVDAAAKGYLGGDDRMGIQISLDRLNSAFSSISAALVEVPTGKRAPLTRTLEQARSEAGAFYQTVATRIVNASNVKIPAGSLYDAGTELNATLTQLLNASGAAATTTLASRVGSLRGGLLFDIALVLIAIGLIHALTWSTEKAVRTPLRHVVKVFDRIAEGKYDNSIDSGRQDELGQVLSALASMQSKLQSQLSIERELATENARIRQALDKTSTGVLLADTSHKIIYLNESARTGFADHASEFKSLREFSAEHLLGASLETLSTSPGEERRALDDLAGPRVEDRSYGSLVFRITTNPVRDPQGTRLGTVMEWKLRTQEVLVEQEMQAVISAVTNDDLTHRINLGDKTGFFATLGEGVNRLADNLAEIVARVKDSAREISLGAEEITLGNTNLSSRTEEQASSLEETASSMEEMTTTVKQNADNAAQANQLALAARDQAEQGVAVVDKAVGAMSGIDESAQKIADIIGVIAEIAFQTNLLALNAAVEAARAGEQGRGFAVVASEVRNLAGRSATAAKEIKSLIQDSVAKVGDGAQLVTRSGETLTEIVTAVKKVSDIVAEIAAASREQSAGIEQVNRAVMQMDQITQQNAALVEETIAASQVMSGQVRDLNDTLGRFRLAGSAAATPVDASSTSSAATTTAAEPPRLAVGESR